KKIEEEAAAAGATAE
nr:RecName: Full=Unknown protein from 2D-PAGE of needles; AltName: Full=N143 [Pinus pinaster]